METKTSARFTLWQVELTDTFGRQPNYSWVKRETLELSASASERQVILAAKLALGLTGQRCRRFNYSCGFELRPVGSCSVAFILPA